MRKIFIILLIALFASSCYKEDALTVEPEKAKYDLSDDPSDPTQHFIHEFYKKYSTVIIKNPNIGDYRFNFTTNNGLVITPPKQDKAILAQGIEFMKKVFFDIYPTEFLKKYLPFSIIMAETIHMNSLGDGEAVDAFGSANFVAISNIKDGVGALSAAQLAKIKGSVNASFWGSYMATAMGIFKVPDSFYAVSKTPNDYYWTNVSNWGWDPETQPLPADDVWYEKGFASYDPETSSIEAADGYYLLQAPGDLDGKSPTDLKLWIELIFSKTPAEMKAICDKHPLMQQKYDILKAAMIAAGFDPSK